MYRYKNILVPLDGSKTAEISLEHVERLSKAEHVGEVTILKVVPIMPPIPDGIQYDAKFVIADREGSEQYLTNIKSNLALKGINVETELLEGSVALSIAEYAKKISADLIIISTHGYGGIQRAIMGSIAYKIIHDREIYAPILLVRPHK